MILYIYMVVDLCINDNKNNSTVDHDRPLTVPGFWEYY